MERGASLGLGVFVPHSCALLSSDDGRIVPAYTGPAPFSHTDKAPFHPATQRGREKGRVCERKGSDGRVEKGNRWESEIWREAEIYYRQRG